VLGLLLLANLGVHLDALDVLPGLGGIALRATLDLFALLIALTGGRVVPAFTANALAARGEAERVRTARCAIGSRSAPSCCSCSPILGGSLGRPA
jgi:uncharacterized protein involved in response to NO